MKDIALLSAHRPDAYHSRVITRLDFQVLRRVMAAVGGTHNDTLECLSGMQISGHIYNVAAHGQIPKTKKNSKYVCLSHIFVNPESLIPPSVYIS